MPIHETFQDLSALGGLPVYVAICAMFFVTNNYNTFWQLVIAFIAVFGITVLTRLTHYTDRPEKQKFMTWYEKIDASSFPSLHAGRTAALAIIIGNFFMQNFYNMMGIDILLITCVIAVCAMRMVLHRHYFTDVLFGVMIGAFVAVLTVLIV